MLTRDVDIMIHRFDLERVKEAAELTFFTSARAPDWTCSCMEKRKKLRTVFVSS